MQEVTQDMQKAGLDAFMTWREAPHGIGFGDVVIAVYSAMEKARAGKEPEPTKYWTGTSDEANAVIAAGNNATAQDYAAGQQASNIPASGHGTFKVTVNTAHKKPAPKTHTKASAKKA